jgi:predicted transcriptional regulator
MCDNTECAREIFMATTKTIFDVDEEAEARAIAEAEADIDAGRVVSHEEVVKWLRSWGTPNELPCPFPKPR